MKIPYSEVPTPNRRGPNRDSELESLHNVKLHLVNVWWHEGRRMARWSQASRKLLSATLLLLRDRMKTVLSRDCTHVKGRGGVKGTVRGLARQVGDFRFVARFDIASYYDSMQHHVLFNLLVQTGMEEPLCALVRQYLELPDLNLTGRGMVAGGALSPLLGALYLLPLDKAMLRHTVKTGIYYVRYMDDIVILAKNRWRLKAAIRELILVIHSLGLDLHQKKRFIGRIDNGFDFLGYRIHPSRKLRPSTESLQRLVTRARRLYEQGADGCRLRQYVARWTCWLWGGLEALVSRKGGVKHYTVFVLKQLQIIEIPFSRA